MKYLYRKYRRSSGPKYKAGKLVRCRGTGKPVLNYSKWMPVESQHKFDDFDEALEHLKKTKLEHTGSNIGFFESRQDVIFFGGKPIISRSCLPLSVKEKAGFQEWWESFKKEAGEL